MGNARARLLYEAHLPDSFQRPQTDQYPSSPPSLPGLTCLFASSAELLDRISSSWSHGAARGEESVIVAGEI